MQITTIGLDFAKKTFQAPAWMPKAELWFVASCAVSKFAIFLLGLPRV